MRRSKLLKESRFVDFLRSTLSWWRSATISASREARDLKSPMTTHQISLSISLMSRSIARLRLCASGTEFTIRTGNARLDGADGGGQSDKGDGANA